MLRKLTKNIIAPVGKQTEAVQRLMNNFQPTSQQQIVNTLKIVQSKKEFVRFSNSVQRFVNKIQYFLFGKSNTFNSRTLHIYQLFRQTNFLTPKFKYGVFSKMTKHLNKISEENLKISNNELQVMLWFLYREYPFYRDTVFQQIAEDHTLRLFQIHDFMNSQKVLPVWEPYLRVRTMLIALGHEPEARKDLTIKSIEGINYTYYPFLTSILSDAKKCQEFRRKQQIYQPVLINLCNRYLQTDQVNYDKYLRYVETLDTYNADDEIQGTIDIQKWEQFIQFFQLFLKSAENTDFDPNLAYKVSQLFSRICESKDIDLESAIRLTNILSNNPHALGDGTFKVFNRIFDVFDNVSSLSYRFLPSRAVVTVLESVAKMQKLSEEQKNRFYLGLMRKLPDVVSWRREDKEQTLDLLGKYKIKTDEKVMKILS